MRPYQLAIAVLSLLVLPLGSIAGPDAPRLAGDQGLAIVKNGGNPIPIVVFKDAPPYTRQAADELANYIEKISGAKPEVIEGVPDPIPEHAVWVGFQPVLEKLFPGIDFEFSHPEEILLAASEKHLVVAGRDRWNPGHMTVEGRSKTIEGKQLEYGTANAVYTFLRDCLNVRWLWPGASGEDVIQQQTIAFEPFEYRYHPRIRARSQIIRFSALGELGRSEDWCRRQRLLLDSLNLGGGHAFSEWFKRFHDTKPELFALQPDGTRSGWPGSPRGRKMGRTTKLCQSNPEVWKQWLADVEEQRRNDPNARVFNASPNDSVLNGVCVCENCVALDHPDGAPCELFWQEAGQEYVALSDRFITLANRLGKMLKERYPDEDLGLSIHAYSKASSPPPVAADPDENVIITYVGHYPWCPDEMWERARKQYLGWVERGAEQMAYRPNVNQGPARRLGLPSSLLDGTLEVFKLLGENNCVGVFIDTIWEHWAARAPEYYLMSQLAWNPAADGRAVLNDYYQRGFGPAAPQIEAYWALLDDACQTFMNSGGDRGIYNSHELYTPELMAKAGKLLDEAAARVRNSPKLADRVVFIRAGYEYAQLILDNVALMNQYLDSGKQDEALASRMRANWDQIKQIFTEYPMAINALRFRGVDRKLHPDFVTYVKPKKNEMARKSVTLQPAEASGWELAFHDDFEQDELGDDWKAVSGTWKIEDGFLRGTGTLVVNKKFAEGEELAGQRLEFEAVSDVAPVLMIKGKPKPRVLLCDMSSFLNAQSPDQVANPFLTGYFFQFGGLTPDDQGNFSGKRNRLLKGKNELVVEENPDSVIIPDKPHKIVAENDGGRLRLFVDGELALEHVDEDPFGGPGQDRVGFYFYSASKVPEVTVYVKKVRKNE